MRIHCLTLSGFGPFRDVQTIDFDALGASGLYLINGPTGAGKSTVIDAICYALYGRLAGDDSDPSRLRSHFAGPHDRTEVDLVFETSAGEFRVIRNPEYYRAHAKSTSAGMVKQAAHCKVYRRLPDGTEEEVAGQIAAANIELARIVGLTRDQFVQTIVLPQGQFASFLNADTKDRAEILKRIFDTALVEKVAEILREDAKQARAARDAITDRITEEIRLLASLIEIDDATSEQWQAWADDSLDEPLSEALQTVEPGLLEEVARGEAEAAAAAASAATADERRATATREAEAAQARDLGAQRADEAATRARAARDQLTTWTDLAESLGITWEPDTTSGQAIDPAPWRDRAAAASTAAGRLDVLIHREQQILSWPAENTRMQQELADLRQQAEHDTERADAIPALITEQQSIAARRPGAGDVEDLVRRENDLADIARQHQALESAAARVPTLADDAAESLRTADASARRAEEAGATYRAGIAADLALTLSPGEPCAVCGAREHPAPAQHAQASVALEEVEHLTAAASADRAAAGAAHALWEEAQATVADLTAALPMTREEWANATAQTTSDRARATERSEQADAAESLLAQLRDEATDISARLVTHREQLAALTTSWEKVAHDIEEAERTVAEARDSYPSVAARAADITALAEGLTAVADRLADLGRAHEAYADAQAVWAALPQHDAFGDTQAAQEAWLAADTARLATDGAATAARQSHEKYHRQVVAITSLQAERVERVAADADLLALAEVFNPGRGEAMGVHIYVLRAMFANVMELANRRLESLLNGRYRLVPTDAGEGDRRSQQGLGVSVLDGFTDKVRPARSLSGGETFCVSLALALGLSDAVRLNAGGIDIGSLFIDEGFGSLDADQLDEVMVMLGHLSSDGRRVGIISHVDSMKTSIVERIDVTPAAQGKPAHLRVSWMS